jgi:hypothetical protein
VCVFQATASLKCVCLNCPDDFNDYTSPKERALFGLNPEEIGFK